MEQKNKYKNIMVNTKHNKLGGLFWKYLNWR